MLPIIRKTTIALAVGVCLLAPIAATAAEDKDLRILQLRKALAEEKIERLRLEYILTKQTLDQIAAELAQKQKEVKPDEKK